MVASVATAYSQLFLFILIIIVYYEYDSASLDNVELLWPAPCDPHNEFSSQTLKQLLQANS